MGSLVALLAGIALAAVPFQYGSGRWHLRWMKTTYDIGLMMLVVFFPWFVVAIELGASRALIPIVMIMFAAAFGVGRWEVWRRARSRE